MYNTFTVNEADPDMVQLLFKQYEPQLNGIQHPVVNGNLPLVIQNIDTFIPLVRDILSKVFKHKTYRATVAYAPGILSMIQNMYVTCKFTGIIACSDEDIPKWLFASIVAVAGALSVYCSSGFALSYDKEMCDFCGIDRSGDKVGSRNIKKAYIRILFNSLGIIEMIKTLLGIKPEASGMPCIQSYILSAWWALPVGLLICSFLSGPQMYMRFGPKTAYALFGDKLSALFFVASSYIKNSVITISKIALQGTVSVQSVIEILFGAFGSIFRYISQSGFNAIRRGQLEHRNNYIPTWNKQLNQITNCQCGARTLSESPHIKRNFALMVAANIAGSYFSIETCYYSIMSMLMLFIETNEFEDNLLEIVLYIFLGVFILFFVSMAGMTRNALYLFGPHPISRPINT